MTAPTPNDHLRALLQQQIEGYRDQLRAKFEQAVLEGCQTPYGARQHATEMVAALPWYADQPQQEVEVPVESAAAVLAACLYAAALSGATFADIIRSWPAGEQALIAEVHARIGNAPEAATMLAAMEHQLTGSLVVAGRARSEAHHALESAVERFMTEIPSGKVGVVEQHLRTMVDAKDHQVFFRTLHRTG